MQKQTPLSPQPQTKQTKPPLLIPHEGQQHLPLTTKRSKLKPLIISLCPKRQSHLTNLFNHPALTPYFHSPTFIPGVPQRDLRNSYKLIQHAGEAGIIPPAEWKVLSSPETHEVYSRDPTQLFQHLESVLPDVEEGRKGSEFDVIGTQSIFFYIQHLYQ